ncbi:glycosyltransferase family 1 protein [uncultured Mailhella sp.]|uniref:glycosyltransferase family 4 protein n=1 Tax=uncultured Mailhella sp. TaxID=1981031 RepID=UPI002619DBF7|nr:glycosyltransferase family 1 protein [uncultured Mailhella sp.]
MSPFWKNFPLFCLSRRRASSKHVTEPQEDDFSRGSVRDWYVAGIRVLRIRKLPHRSRVEICGLPLLQIRRSACKTRYCCGRIELLKLRVSGPLSGSAWDGPLFLPRERHGRRCLFWNIGSLAFQDERSGVARVTRCLLRSLRSMHSFGYDVYPVYTTGDRAGYVHARSFLRRMEGVCGNEALDEPVIFQEGDLLLTPIPDVREVETHFHALKTLQNMGVAVLFFVHDLIPLQHPAFCPDAFRENFARWLPLISRFDGVLTISEAVAEEYRAWRRENVKDDAPFFVNWFHLGSDIESVSASQGLPDSAVAVLSAMKSRPSFLEVSTVEPRKGYGQALAAFERLWAKGIDANFVIVGRKGWKIDKLAGKIDKHPENGKRLFWLKGIGDEYLDKVYESASCVLFPSEAEGFGLAVVEGARRGKPLILRDLPVFREIAGDHATYFSGLDPQPLADCIETWLEDLKKGRVIPSSGIKLLTWEESAEMLLSRLPLK